MTLAILFDLDNTLASTKSLEAVRLGQCKWADLPAETLATIKPYPKVPRLIETLCELGIKLGVVTNSPKRYCIPLLEHLGLKKYFETIITYDDVLGAIKPNPKGITLALENLGVAPHPLHLYFGDDLNDVAAAYRAGITPVLGSWGSRTPVNTTPALILSSSDVISYCSAPTKFQLCAEVYAANSALNKPQPPELSDLYFLGLNLDGHCVTMRNEVSVLALGRYFSQKSVTTARHHDEHDLSKHIEKKSSEIPFAIPKYWVDLFAELITKLPKNKISIDYVTIIPSKPEDEDKRMERFLGQIEAQYRLANPDSKILFKSDALQFCAGAKKMKTLGYEARQEEVNKSLHLGNSGALTGKSVLVIDDVTTSLATIRRAHALFTEAGANHVLGIVLAKTVSIQEDHKECPSCGRLMRIRRNNKDNSRFWGCSGYFEQDANGNRACTTTLSIT